MMDSNYDKKKFSITITVCENCQTIEVDSFDSGYTPSYQEIIGTLECMKASTIFRQTGINLERYRKWEKEQKRKNDSGNSKTELEE